MQQQEPTSPPSQRTPSPKKRGSRTARASQPPQAQPLPRSSGPHTPEEWRDHWKAQGFPWRTEPEIDVQRQEELAKRRSIVPDVEKGIHPFNGMKLNRAEIEWLLATHENGRGPIDWSDESQRTREGLDVRGADLSGSADQQSNLAGLPLARLVGGRNLTMRLNTTKGQRKPAIVTLTGADLIGAQLEGADLSEALLTGADLIGAHLGGANLFGAQLEGACLRNAQLEGANLSEAQLEGADLIGAHLEGDNLRYAHLEGAYLIEAYLEGADLSGAHLEGAYLGGAHLEGAYLGGAHLKGAALSGAHLKGANLFMAYLESTDLRNAQLEKADLSGARLDGAYLSNVILTDNDQIGPSLVDVQWGTANLIVIDWSQVASLNDEHKARKNRGSNGKGWGEDTPLTSYKDAVRANRQLSVALREQGLNEDASRFAYRAQSLQKEVFWFQMIQDSMSLRKRMRALGDWLFSWFLFLLAGYGYKPLRSFLAYVLVIAGFATIYYLLGVHDLVGPHHLLGPHYLSWYEAIVVSMTAFHGRGFFVGTFSPADPQALVAAIEAFFGLLIEVTFIATLTQRLFSR